MSERARKDRAGSRQSRTPASPPARRSARRTVDIDPQLAPESSMPPPPTRGGRALRSQSKEEETQAAIPRRGTRRDLRERSVGSVTSNFTKVTGTEIYSDYLKPHNLSTVVEGDSDHLQVETGSHRQSSVARSEENETPAKRLARSRLMKTLLQRLFSASDDLRNHLLNARGGDETWEVELESYRQAFATYQANYADADNFIDPTYVLSRLGAPEGSPVWYTASKVVSAANIAVLLDDLTTLHPDAEDILNCLQRWDQIFPLYFFPEKESGQPDWMTSQDSFDYALQIRTQLLISTLRKFDGPEYDPFTLVANIFCSHGTRPDEVRKFLNGDDGSLQLKSLAGIDLNGEEDDWLRERYVSQLQSLCFLLADEKGVPNNLAQLREDHPFNPFADGLGHWAHTCFEEIKAAMQAAHSSTLFGSAGQGSVGGSQFDSQGISQPIVRAPPGQAAAAPGLSQIQLLKQMEHQLAGTPPSAQGDQAITTDDVLRRKQEIQSSNYPPSSRDIAFSQAGVPHNDVSAYAGPILGGDASDSGIMYAESAASLSGGTKRRRAADDDDDFETDSRIPDNQRRVGGEPSTKRARFDRPASDSAALGNAGSQAPDEDQLIKNPPSSYMDPDLGALSQKSREMSMAARKPKEPQMRTPWSRHDCRLLIRAVDAYKCRWSTIEKEIQNGTIPFEHPRDQQALRDKARLLKQDFLKADGVLPPGFDLVVLGRKEKTSVMLCGKNPDRKEADLDEDNMPTNTAFQG